MPAIKENELLQDIGSALISEMISREFYSLSSTQVKLISGTHAFQDMMWEEEKHVVRLKEEYLSLRGKRLSKCAPKFHYKTDLPLNLSLKYFKLF